MSHIVIRTLAGTLLAFPACVHVHGGGVHQHMRQSCSYVMLLALEGKAGRGGGGEERRSIFMFALIGA